ncbi:MAG: Rsd/AlgQ family anti-sigma factor, partial [Gammaproteobacteria bacterium]
MAVAIQPAVERRNQVSHLIQELVHERQQVWSLYCRVAEFKPFSSSEEHVKKILAEFCQILIDYISLGHFGIYQRILEGK